MDPVLADGAVRVVVEAATPASALAAAHQLVDAWPGAITEPRSPELIEGGGHRVVLYAPPVRPV